MIHFCTYEVKKFMMEKADRLRDRFFKGMIEAWKAAVMTAMVTFTAGVADAWSAEIPEPRTIAKYENFQDPSFDPAYTIARKAMRDLYKGSEYDDANTDPVNPFLDIAQIDLDGDRLEEIIAVPVPSYPETAKLCTGQQICPFYILQVRDKNVHILGIIKAALIDRGDDVKNGFWTLKVYQRNDAGRFVTPVNYVFDKKTDSYLPEVPVPNKSPTKPTSPAPATP